MAEEVTSKAVRKGAQIFAKETHKAFRISSKGKGHILETVVVPN